MPVIKLIPATYLGPVHLFAHVVNADKIIIEQFSNYQRKTYSNRCSITGANGPMDLTIPILNKKNEKTIIKQEKKHE